jgi:hypothetical protein
MRRIARCGGLTLVVVLFILGRGFSQGDHQNAALAVSGHPGQVPVTQINGRPYVAVDALARLMNGSLGYQGSQITLTFRRRARSGLPPANLRIRHSPEIF